MYMKIIEENIPIKSWKYPIFNTYFNELNPCVFDIETTGLYPDKNQIILLGFIEKKSSGFVLKQFFAESLEEEPLLLIEGSKILNTSGYLITYNGKSFDIPFFRKRLLHYNLPDLRPLYNLDLYFLVRQYSDISKYLPNLKQTTLENFMGFWTHRLDTINGKESISIYYDYLDSFDDSLLKKILLHNSDDVSQLYRLIEVIKKTDFHKGMFFLGYPITPHIFVSSIEIKKQALHIEGYCGDDIKSYCGYDTYDINYDIKDSSFDIKIPLISYNKLLLVDFKNFPLSEDNFIDSPNYASGCLVLYQNKTINYKDINLLVKFFLERIIKNGL